jgi:hypothetical protein
MRGAVGCGPDCTSSTPSRNWAVRRQLRNLRYIWDGRTAEVHHLHSHAYMRQHVLTLTCANMSTTRTCKHAHMVAHVHARKHTNEDTYTAARRHKACTRNIHVHPPATFWPTLHLRQATERWRTPTVREPAPQRAPRLHMLSRADDDVSPCRSS